MTKKEKREFLIGTLLGDASFSGKKNKHIMFGHCEKQKEYGEWKLEIISKLYGVGSNSCLAKGMTSPNGNRQNFYRFWTTTHHKFTSLYNEMVVDGKKEITDKIIKRFSPLSLAILFMDDGCKETCNGKIKAFKISLGGFSEESVRKLANKITMDFGIETKVYLEHGKYPCIKITRNESKERFVNLVIDHIHKSMLYKFQV